MRKVFKIRGGDRRKVLREKREVRGRKRRERVRYRVKMSD